MGADEVQQHGAHVQGGQKINDRDPKKVFEGFGDEIVRALLDNDMMRAQGLILGGADVTYMDPAGQSTLHLAAWRQAVGVTRLILENLASPPLGQRGTGMPSIMGSGSGAEPKMMIPRSPVEVLDAQDRTFEATALHIAASRNDVLTLRHLLEGKADPNLISVEGDTPLSRAAGRGHLNIVKKLLENKTTQCDVLERDVEKNVWLKAEEEMASSVMGSSPMSVGSPMMQSSSPSSSPSSPQSVGSPMMQSPQARGRTSRRRPPMSPLLKACKRNAKIEIVAELLKAKCGTQRCDEKLNQPLHCAAHYGNANNCRALLQAGADANVRNHLGRTPLHFAARSGHPRVLKMLLDAGANVNAEDVYGQTALAVAADPQVVKILQKAGGKQGSGEMHPEHGAADVSAPVSPLRSRSQSPSRVLAAAVGGPVAQSP